MKSLFAEIRPLRLCDAGDAVVLDAGNLDVLKLTLPLQANEFAFRAFGVRKQRSTSLHARVEKKKVY